MPHIPFRKMHGLGNDFVVLDRRRDSVVIDAATARALADRRTGVGCDQLILIEPASDPAAQVFMRILNADGSEAEACGNGTRCIARLVADETGEKRIRIETVAGLLDAEGLAAGRGAVDTGACGSGACAALVAASRRGLTGRHAQVILDGGMLDIEWRADGHIIMTGPATLAFEGIFDAALLAGSSR